MPETGDRTEGAASRVGQRPEERPEKAKRPPPSSATLKPVPPEVLRRIHRGALAIAPYIPKWEEALAFYDNEQYAERSAVTGDLQHVETREGDPHAKPRWRQRLIRNRYTSAIQTEKAAMTSRTPYPECTAPSGDRRAINAAKLSQKALQSAYSYLGMRRVAADAMVYALNCGGGYVWPFFNPELGEFVLDHQPGEDPASAEMMRTGEIDFWVLHPREVLWEPGETLAHSRWVAVRKARPVDVVIAADGYTGPKDLQPDALATSKERLAPDSAELVYVYEYLERPSRKNPAGRWLTIANAKLIADEQIYPCNTDVQVVHAIEDVVRPHRDRPMGRGEMALDIQRTWNRTWNQILQWKNLVLNPQMLAPKGSIRTPRTNEPGLVIEYRPMGGQAPQWIQVQDIPSSLFNVLNQCIEDFREVFGQSELPAGVESGAAVAGINERDATRRADFAANVADFYSTLLYHVLYLMQKHYTEPRMLQFKSRFGIESIPDFMGAQLMKGITVQVYPASFLPRTRAEQEAKIIMYAERGWLPPYQAMQALDAGTLDAVIDDFELDISKANREINQLEAMGRGEGDGPVFAGPADNHEVHKWVVGNWMKTEDFERQDPMVKQATLLHYQQHEAELKWLAMEQLQQQELSAAEHGLAGAAGEKSGTKPPPSLPSMEGTTRALQGNPRGQRPNDNSARAPAGVPR